MTALCMQLSRRSEATQSKSIEAIDSKVLLDSEDVLNAQQQHNDDEFNPLSFRRALVPETLTSFNNQPMSKDYTNNETKDPKTEINVGKLQVHVKQQLRMDTQKQEKQVDTKQQHLSSKPLKIDRVKIVAHAIASANAKIRNKLLPNDETLVKSFDASNTSNNITKIKPRKKRFCGFKRKRSMQTNTTSDAVSKPDALSKAGKDNKPNATDGASVETLESTVLTSAAEPKKKILSIKNQNHNQESNLRSRLRSNVTISTPNTRSKNIRKTSIQNPLTRSQTPKHRLKKKSRFI